MMETIRIRIHLSTLNKIKRSFFCRKDETAASYFKRLSVALEAGWDKILKIDPHGKVGAATKVREEMI